MKNFSIQRLIKYALILGVAVFVMGLTPVHADTITYSINGTFTGGGSLSGTVTIDTTAGSIVGGNFTAGGTTYSVAFLGGNSPTEYAEVFTAAGSPSSNPMFILFISIAPDGSLSLCSTANGAICGDVSFFTLDGGSTTTLASGSIVAQTPEPATYLLLGSGLLGLVLISKKRFATNS